MRKLVLLISLLVLTIGCQQTVPTTKENLQKIFDSKDFTVSFIPSGEELYFMGLRQDYVTYKHNGETVRKTITYDQALLISTFIKKKIKEHKDGVNDGLITVESAQYRVDIQLDEYQIEFDNLLAKLNW